VIMILMMPRMRSGLIKKGQLENKNHGLREQS